MPTEASAFQSDASGPSLRLLARISHYEILSRMWSAERNGDTTSLSSSTYRQLPDGQEAQVIVRDFAYSRMAAARNKISEATATTFAELLSGPTVDIYVGKDKRRWSIHRNLLCHYSSYFEAEFIGNEVPKAKKPGDNQRLDLPHDDPEGFALFVKWLYQGQLDDVSAFSEEKKYDYSVACHKLYMLCDRFDIPELKNISIDQYRRGLLEAQLVPDAEEINEIYRQSPTGSPFRKLMTQIAARQIMDPDNDKDAETYRVCFHENPDFAVDMVNAIKTGTGGMLFEDPTEGLECDYHDHTGDKSCLNKDKNKSRGPSSSISSQRQSHPPKLSPQRRRTPTISQGTTNNVNGVVGQRSIGSDGPVTGGQSSPGRSTQANGASRGGPVLVHRSAKDSTPQKVNGANGVNGVNGVNGHGVGGGNEGRLGSSGDDNEDANLSPSKRKPAKLRRRSPPPVGTRSTT